MQSETNVALVVASFNRSGADLAAAVGLVPDAQWTRGEPVDPTRPEGARRRSSGLRYESRLPSDIDVEEHLAELVARLRPYKDRLTKLAAELSREEGGGIPVRFWVYTDTTGDWSRAFDFPPSLLQEVAAFGAYFGIGGTV